jgi:hypothetical protein
MTAHSRRDPLSSPSAPALRAELLPSAVHGTDMAHDPRPHAIVMVVAATMTVVLVLVVLLAAQPSRSSETQLCDVTCSSGVINPEPRRPPCGFAS